MRIDNVSARFSVIVAVVLLSCCAFVRAQTITFDDPQALKSNFRLHAGADAMAVEKVDDSQALTFTQEKPITAVAVYEPGGKVMGGADQTIVADFRMEEMTSFGFYFRATADEKDSYMVVVNAFPKKGGLLRAFRTSMWPQRDPIKDVIASKNTSITPDTWYQLRVVSKNVGDTAVDISASIYPIDATGKAAAKPLVELKTTAKDQPLLAAGQIAVRMNPGPNNGKVALRSMTVTPELKPLEK